MLLEDKRKSREQNFRDFFESLQLEFIVSELRYKIYPDSKSDFCNRKNKSLEIMNEKRKRIIDIAIKNKLNTIFTDIFIGDLCLFDAEIKERLYNKIYPIYGFPNFIYRDDKQKSILEKFDKLNYYKKGEKFLVEYIGEGVLISYNIDTNKCSIMLKNNTMDNVDISEIKRIFI